MHCKSITALLVAAMLAVPVHAAGRHDHAHKPLHGGVLAETGDIDAELENLRERQGKQVPVETDIQANDIVRLKVRELEEGKLKDGGHTHEFEILVERLEDGVKSEFMRATDYSPIR